jgi:hypothetical protein
MVEDATARHTARGNTAILHPRKLLTLQNQTVIFNESGIKIYHPFVRLKVQ